MFIEAQLNNIMKIMVECYKNVYGTAIVHGERVQLQEKLKTIWDTSAAIGLENDIIVSPTVIPYEEYVKYKQSLPYYNVFMVNTPYSQ